ncbi:MAG: dipeptidase [Clostridia bacterium]|nr:dipeptidase [Clostridia bacterium]
MKIIDMHCDTFWACYPERKSIRKNDGHIDLEKLIKGDSMAQFFAIFIPKEDTEDVGVSRMDYFNSVRDFYLEELQKNKDLIRPVYTVSDLEKNLADGKLSSVLTIEDSALVEGKMERIGELKDKGVSLMTLTWNYENCFGYPNSSDPAIHAKGLKDFGKEAVKEMNRKGIIVDVSHLSSGGLKDVVKVTSKPIVASHSCARALSNDQRNLWDDEMKLIADTDGTIGVNFYSEFLREGCFHSYLDDILEHTKYMVNKVGIDHVSLGSDFDGIDCTLDLKDFTYMPKLVEGLSKTFKDSDLEKICYGNTLRVMKENL